MAMAMARVLQLRRSLSKPPQLQFSTLLGVSYASNLLEDRVKVSINTNSPHGFRDFYAMGGGRYYNKFASCNAEEANDLIREVDGWKLLSEGGKLKLSRSWRVKNLRKGLDFFKLLSGVVDADGKWSDLGLSYRFLHLVGWTSLTYKITTNEVELDPFELLSDVVDAEGILSYLDFEFKGFVLGGWNRVTIVIWTEAVDRLTQNDLDIALKINKVDPQHLMSRRARFLDQLKKKAANILA